MNRDSALKRFPGTIAALGCLAFAIALTWPTLPQLGESVIGHERCTNLMHVWTYWAVYRGLGDGDLPILFDYIFYPVGGNLIRLYGSDLLYPVIMSPLVALFGADVLFNVKILFSMTLAPLGVYHLLRYLGVSFGPALAGGFLFMATPYFLLETLNGTAELVSVEWIPFACLFLLKALKNASKKEAALSALFIVLSIYASAYNAFFIALFALLAIFHQMAYGDDAFWSWRRIAAGLTLGGLAAVAMVPFVLLHRTGETAASLTAKRSTFTSATSAPTADASADLIRFVRPGRNTIPEVFIRDDGGRDEVYTTYTTYIGFTTLALALVAVARRRPRTRLWAWGAIFFLAVAMGPYLRLLGEPVTIAGEAVPLPSLLLYHYFPGFAVTARHTYRYVTMLHLCMAVLAAFGLQFILNNARTQSRALGAIILLPLLSVGEVLAFGPAPWPVPRAKIDVPDYYTELAEDNSTLAIVELPFTRNHLKDLQRYLYYQTVHEKKYIDGGMHFRVGEGTLDFVRANPLAQSFLAEHTISRPISESMASFSTRMFQKRGYRYILVHDTLFEVEEELELSHTFLTDLYGPPTDVGDGIKRYEIRTKEGVEE